MKKIAHEIGKKQFLTLRLAIYCLMGDVIGFAIKLSL